MRKETDFNLKDELRLDERTEDILQRGFDIPDAVERAKSSAFDKIRMQPAKKRHFWSFSKTAGSFAAAAAVFSVVCISNPALAANIPLIGHVFEELGSSLGFSGDYSNYAKPLADSAAAGADEASTETAQKETDAQAATESAYTKTVDGVTVSLSEIYCNEMALYLSMVIESEDPIPDTMLDQNGNPLIDLNASWGDTEMKLSYNPDFDLTQGILDGKLIDENTYAGVLRVDLGETTTENAKLDELYAARDAFLEEKGFSTQDIVECGSEKLAEIAAALGMEEYSDAGLGAVGGPDLKDYVNTVDVPETFSFDLAIHKITGMLPESEMPAMPEELQSEYDQAMADLGLNEDDYENFTEEQKDQELKLFNEMWNKYYEMYPEAQAPSNSYNSWTFEGDWEFQVDVTLDHEQTVTKEINDIDENGIGILSVTKTPFEIVVKDTEADRLCFTVVLDANGNQLNETGGNTNILAVGDHDVSKVDIYMCDYTEYMDELKANAWETLGYDSFKDLMNERALHHTEVVFEE